MRSSLDVRALAVACAALTLGAACGASPSGDVTSDCGDGAPCAGSDAGLDPSRDGGAAPDAGHDAGALPGGPLAPLPLRLLQANIGNVDFACRDVKGKLCETAVEARLARGIAAVDPDVLLLQEVLPFALCKAKASWPDDHACHATPGAPQPVPDQVRRLLGSGYTVVCEPAHGWDCVAVRSALVESIAPDREGRACRVGDLCGNPANHGAAPGAGLSDYRVPTIDSTDDEGFHIFDVEVRMAGRTVHLVSGHPQSGFGFPGMGAATAARADQITRMFDRVKGHARVLVGGDMNMDPFAKSGDASTEAWSAHVDRYDDKGALTREGRFRYHSGIVERVPPWPTTSYLAPLPNHTLDHVVSTFATGSCATRRGDARLDGGRGMDHFALDCALVLP